MLVVASIFKEITINKKMRLDHQSLSSPETRILKYHEYKKSIAFAYTFFVVTFRHVAEINRDEVNGTKVLD